MRTYRIAIYCLGVRYQWFGLYANDWDAIDAMQTRFPQAEAVIPHRLKGAAA